MKELKCPNCGEIFKVDESNYAALLQQVRTQEFDEDLHKQLEAQLKIKEQEMDSAHKEELQKLKDRYEQESQENERTIDDLNHKLESANEKIDAEIFKAVTEKESKITKLESQINELKREAEQEKENIELKKQLEIKDLKEKNTNDIRELQNCIETLKMTHKTEIESKEALIQQLRDFKIKLSTKMVGESLEKHCENEFENIRALAFPNAEFGKDNDISDSHSKGDYIYREKIDGVELISIMFEMKNENETTATKHKNEHFLKKLDSDRNKKNCEYAVLVSMLEADNDVYNQGIVDVSHKFDKMYVIRPQFFIPIIGLLRNAALKNFETKLQLKSALEQNIDIANFEENLNNFKTGFAKNYNLASRQFQDAIEEIDKTIDHLKKVKENLTKSQNNLRLANNKADDISIKKLTKNAPSVRELFENQNALPYNSESE